MKRSLLIALALWQCAAAQEALTPERARELARQNSPVLRQFAARQRESRYAVDEAYTLAYPRVNLSASYTRQTPTASLNLPGRDIPFLVEHNYNVALSLRQALYTFGRLEWSAARAELTEKARLAELRDQEARVEEEAEVAFYEACRTVEQVRAARASLESRQEHLRNSELMVRAGTTPGLDVKRDQAALASARQTLLEAESARDLAFSRLATLLSLPRGQTPQLAPPETLPPPPREREESLRRALETRPDLLASRWAVEAARARVEMAEAEDNPSLDLQSDYVQRNAVAFNPGQLWSTSLVFSLPLFDGGLSESRANQAREVVTQLQSIDEQSRRLVTLEVDAAFLDLLKQWGKLETAREARTAAAEAFRISSLRYQAGVAPNMEELDAAATLARAEADLVDARFFYLQAVARWRRVAGSQGAAGGQANGY